jgi:plasmid stabilization system protein ParE
MIFFSSEALSDLERIRRFLEFRNPGSAPRALGAILAALDQVEHFSEIGHSRLQVFVEYLIPADVEIPNGLRHRLEELRLVDRDRLFAGGIANGFDRVAFGMPITHAVGYDRSAGGSVGDHGAVIAVAIYHQKANGSRPVGARPAAIVPAIQCIGRRAAGPAGRHDRTTERRSSRAWMADDRPAPRPSGALP